MTGPAELAEAAESTSADWDDLAHYPTCGDGNRALCGVDLADSVAGSDSDLVCVVCEDIDARLPGCGCTPRCSCCTPRGFEPSYVIFDEIHYFTGGAA